MKWGGGFGSAVLPWVQSMIRDTLMSFLRITGYKWDPLAHPAGAVPLERPPHPLSTSSITSDCGLGQPFPSGRHTPRSLFGRPARTTRSHSSRGIGRFLMSPNPLRKISSDRVAFLGLG